MGWRSTSPQLASRHTEQDCICDESRATCDDLTDSRVESSLRARRQKRLKLGLLNDMKFYACAMFTYYAVINQLTKRFL